MVITTITGTAAEMRVVFYVTCSQVRVVVQTVQVLPAILQHAVAAHHPDQVQIRVAAAEMPPGEIINLK